MVSEHQSTPLQTHSAMSTTGRAEDEQGESEVDAEALKTSLGSLSGCSGCLSPSSQLSGLSYTLPCRASVCKFAWWNNRCLEWSRVYIESPGEHQSEVGERREGETEAEGGAGGRDAPNGQYTNR